MRGVRRGRRRPRRVTRLVTPAVTTHGTTMSTCGPTACSIWKTKSSPPRNCASSTWTRAGPSEGAVKSMRPERRTRAHSRPSGPKATIMGARRESISGARTRRRTREPLEAGTENHAAPAAGTRPHAVDPGARCSAAAADVLVVAAREGERSMRKTRGLEAPNRPLNRTSRKPSGTSAGTTISNAFCAPALGLATMRGFSKTSPEGSSRSEPWTVTTFVEPGAAPAGKTWLRTACGSCARAPRASASPNAAGKTRRRVGVGRAGRDEGRDEGLGACVAGNRG